MKKRKYIEKTVEAIKLAYLSHSPIVWIVTPTIETANDIAVAFAEEHFGGMQVQVKTEGQVIPEPSYQKIENWMADCDWKSPKITFDWVDEYNIKGKDIVRAFQQFLNLHLSIDVFNRPIPNSILFSDKAKAEAEAKAKAEARRKYNYRQSMIIIASPASPDFGWINRYINVVYVGSLQDDEINEIIDSFMTAYEIKRPDPDSFRESLIVNFRGISEREIKEILTKCLVSEYFDSDSESSRNKILREIRLRKRQMLDGFNGLKWIPIANASPASGLGAITKWLEERKDIFSDPERKQKEGFDVPKGVLVTGIPGTGKSLMAKEAARILNLPLIAMDLGDLQEGIVGKSEEHMAAALRMVDAMAPCVLWIDEIEKAFSGANSGKSDGGVMRRMFGKFLTWMQEKQSFCLVFATSNDISELPPELFRSERFDEKFFNFMPSVDECAAIFSSCIQYHNSQYEKNNGNEQISFFEDDKEDKWGEFFKELLNKNAQKDESVDRCQLFTGADIATLVKILKFKVLCSSEIKERPIVCHDLESIAENVLDKFKSYGETNLENIASSLISLTHNNFQLASDNEVIKSLISDIKNSGTSIDANASNNQILGYDDLLKKCIRCKAQELLENKTTKKSQI